MMPCVVKFPYLFSKLTIIINAFYFDITALFPIGCAYSEYTFAHKLIAWTLLPFVVILIIVIMAVAEYKYKTRNHALGTHDEDIFKDKYYTEGVSTSSGGTGVESFRIMYTMLY